ncbi:MAG: acyl-CoA thioesterase [Ignavibacteriales bacterium]|nr:acyl-CoA thioesterase [Ignavibacteriales bacterium]
MDIKDSTHKITVKVRFHEVDMLGVCNNAVYINFFEHARLEYVKEVGLMPEGGIFSDGRLFFMVRNEINYLGHSFYDDELDVYSRVSYIKNSSFGYDHIIVRKKTGEVIVDGKGVVVFVDLKTRKSTPLTEDFIEKIKKFEPRVQILK